VPEAVSLLLALVCTVAIVTLFLWPLWAPLLRARRLRACWTATGAHRATALAERDQDRRPGYPPM
jgi:hypothetical protein